MALGRRSGSSHLSGLRHDPLIAWFYRTLTFEKLILVTVPIILVGLLVSLKVIVQWVASGFSDLDEARLLFFAMLCLVNAVQIGAAGYLFSIMVLPRHIGPFATDSPEGDKE